MQSLQCKQHEINQMLLVVIVEIVIEEDNQEIPDIWVQKS
jgi:hypothetical protein